jgi:hypothetical protein
LAARGGTQDLRDENPVFHSKSLQPSLQEYSKCHKKKKNKLRCRSPQVNYTDRATAACWRSECQPFQVEGVVWSVQQIPMAVNLGFLDQSPYSFIQVVPQLSSQGRVDPIPDPLLLRKSGRAGNRTWGLWIHSQKP